MKNWILALFVVSLFILSGCVEPKVCNTLSEEHLTFFQDYLIAVSDINLALNSYSLAMNNLQIGNDYVNTGDYNYESALVYFDAGSAQIKIAKVLLDGANAKLSVIISKAPNLFFISELALRQNQVNALIRVVGDVDLMLSYAKQQLYETNYGSKDKASEFLKKYSSVLTELNLNIQKLAEINGMIDSSWQQNWYSTEGQVWVRK